MAPDLLNRVDPEYMSHHAGKLITTCLVALFPSVLLSLNLGLLFYVVYLHALSTVDSVADFHLAL